GFGENGIYGFVGRGSGGRRGWMWEKYGEVVGVRERGVGKVEGLGDNECYSWGVYGEKVHRMKRKVGEG
ncbi:beta-galactosidase, partial [Paenibacillus sp. Y412MC10]|uniref:beta-galactosidase n=1 Tax=Geobacillus sp. (strain Y412MC10) TaxID=481743 RepID=UPI0011AA9FCE